MKQLIRYGKHTIYQKELAIAKIDNLVVDEMHEFEIIIKPYKVNKTLEQLGYYWDVIVPICANYQGESLDDASNALEDAHESLKGECLMVKTFYRSLSGEIKQKPVSIKKLKVGQMSEYIDNCINLLGSMGVTIPPPTRRGE